MAEGAAGGSGGGSSGGGGGGGGGDTRPSESASAKTMRQALLLATQAVGVNEAAMCEARAERDAITEEIEWVEGGCDGEIERARVRETGAVHATGSAAGGTESAERARQVLDAKSEERARQALLLVTRSLGVSADAVREARAERDAANEELDRACDHCWGDDDGDDDDYDNLEVFLVESAAKVGASYVLRLALSHGLFKRTARGALVAAAYRGHLDCLRVMLGAGPDNFKIPDRIDSFPKDDMRQKLIDLLRQAAAVGNTDNVQGWTLEDLERAERLAAEYGHDDCVQLLVENKASFGGETGNDRG